MSSGKKVSGTSARFTNGDEIRRALVEENYDVLKNSLLTLRNQFSLDNEVVLSPQDERLLLAKSWLDKSPGASDLFDVWDRSSSENNTTCVSLSLSIISSVLSLLSQHYVYHASGLPILKSLISPPILKHLNSLLGGAQTDLILGSLKLLNSMVEFGGGRETEKRAIMEGFGWGMKSLSKLFYMRRKTSTPGTSTTSSKPDIRTLFIKFLLSFLSTSTPTSLKLALLEDHRDHFLGIFKGLYQDSYRLIKDILECLWEGVWCDGKLRRTLKVGLFGDITLQQIIKLYDRAEDERSDTASGEEQIPADVAHHFLLAITTRPGVGVCFKDRGWYPRQEESFTPENVHDEAEEDEATTVKRGGGKIHNRILANLLKALKVNEDPRQLELAIRVLEAAPELVSGFWISNPLTLEPRLSSRWLTNISILTSIISLPIPITSFLQSPSNSSASPSYRPSPPPLSSIISSILPTPFSKASISKGLSPSQPALVQHQTALALSKCLTKFRQVVDVFRKVEESLEEGDGTTGEWGQWGKRRNDVEREIRRRVPDFQVIVAFSQAHPYQHQGSEDGDGGKQSMLLNEAALRLLWLYHRTLPSLAAEARFDVGKLVMNLVIHSSRSGEEEGDAMDVDSGDDFVDAKGLAVIGHLHVLRILKESDSFSWSSKLAGSPYTHLYHLLKLYTLTRLPPLRSELADLLTSFLSQSILFEHDPSELALWLETLPRRSGIARSLVLGDEGESVLNFLDDCLMRCLKTPYRYIEELSALLGGRGEDDAATTDFTKYPSPLLMTMLEQISAKLRSATPSLRPSDALSIFTYLRNLLLAMLRKFPFASSFARTIHGKLDAILKEVENGSVFEGFDDVRRGVREEVKLLEGYLNFLGWSPLQRKSEPSRDAESFLQIMEAKIIPVGYEGNLVAEAIDWYRLCDRVNISPQQFRRLTDLALRLSPNGGGLLALLNFVDPGAGFIWDMIPDPANVDGAIIKALSFDQLYLHATPENLENPHVRALLVNINLSTSLIGHVRLVLYRISQLGKTETVNGSLFLLAEIMGSRNLDDLREMKWMVFTESRAVRDLCFASCSTESGLYALVNSTLNPQDQHDRELVGDFCSHWVRAIAMISVKEDLTLASSTLETASLWTRFADVESVLQCVDAVVILLQKPAPEQTQAQAHDLLEQCARVLVDDPATHATAHETHQRIMRILSLKRHLLRSDTFDTLVGLVVQNILPVGHDEQPLRISTSLADLTKETEQRWRIARFPLGPTFDIGPFIPEDSWADVNDRLASAIVYRTWAGWQKFGAWLATRRDDDGTSFVRPLHAFLDANWISSSTTTPVSFDLDATLDAIYRLIPNLLDAIGRHSSHEDVRWLSASCLRTLATPRYNPAKLAQRLLTSVADLPPTRLFRPSVVRLIDDIGSSESKTFSTLTELVVDRGLEWVVRRFSEDPTDSPSFLEALSTFGHLVSIAPIVKVHLAEPVLTATIQHRISSAEGMQFAHTLASRIIIKPANLNRMLQNLIHHKLFYSCASTSDSSPHSIRPHIISFLYLLFHMQPTNTCQLSHITPLMRIYHGTLAPPDRNILSILSLFEVHRGLSTASIFRQWSSQPLSSSTNITEAVLTLDSSIVFRTCTSLPTRVPREGPASSIAEDEAALYDPLFLVLLLGAMLEDSPPSTGLDWVQVFRTNIVSLAICTAASKDPQARQVALLVLSGVINGIKDAVFQEKEQVTYIFHVLRSLYSEDPSVELVPRQPTYSLLLLAHAHRSIFYPASFLYPLVSRFLLQRPELDKGDVPLLFSMLYSSTDDWKKERSWMLKFIGDGMKSTNDWRVLKRRHTWELLASLFQSGDNDRPLRNAILEILQRLTSNAQATTFLVLRSSLLSWIEIQVSSAKSHEISVWFSILDNIVRIVDHQRTENATRGGWRASICISLTHLIDIGGDINSLDLGCRTLLRLSNLSYGSPPILASTMENCASKLFSLEKSMRPYSPTGDLSTQLVLSPELESWGQCVLSLWRIASACDHTDIWDAITCRVLLWGSIKDVKGCAEAEWVRKETLHCLSS